MTNTETQISILEDFQRQLQKNNIVTKGMVTSIEKALDSNFITSNVRLESYTDTPTSINLDKTIDAVKNKLSDLVYIQDSEKYTLDNYMEDLYKLRALFFNSIKDLVVKYTGNISPEIITFLEDPNNRKYYNSKNIIRDAFDSSIISILKSENDFSNHLHGLINKGMTFDKAEEAKAEFINELYRLENSYSENVNDEIFVYPFYTFFSVERELGMSELSKIAYNDLCYQNITLETILNVNKIVNNNRPAVYSNFKEIENCYEKLLTGNTPETLLDSYLTVVKEQSEIVHKFESNLGILEHILKYMTKL